MTGAHGRTRTCTSLVRNQELYPVELRVRFGSPTRTRTWIGRLTTGCPAIGRSGKELVEHLGLEPSSISLQGRSADPARAPIGFALRGPDPSAPRARSGGEKGLTPRIEDSGAWGRFRAHLSAASTSWRSQASLGRAITRSASQANELVRPTGIEPVSARWHRAALPLSYGRWCEIVSGGSAPLPTET